ncbi:MAG: tRNA lysidine(34) synthetase TilS [Mycoplasmoidaceae bacterium]|nr:tRNA lysidine(34) synthetase TilS [Mycoplasmoidaceae bacterium]
MNKNKCIAAVSGGPDSMALLHKFRRNIIAVCHVNYHKRVDSDYDTKIVKEYCAKHNIRLFVHNVNPSVYASSPEHNFQTLARQIRYEFFVKCAQKVHCNNLLIAHNLNDFIETAIMQENRHSLNFFYGIKKQSTYKTLKIDRPLLREFKSDLEKYCTSKKIAYAIDSSNSLDIYERNRIRKQLSKLSKKELMELYRKYQKRNKRHEKIEKIINKHLQV